MKECVYAKANMNYIKRRHRAYLWMFRLIPSVDIDNKTGTVTIVWTKYAFGKIFVMGEEIRKFEEEFVGTNFDHLNLLQSRPYGKQYNAFLRCVKQIEAGQNAVFVGKKWMMVSTDSYQKLTNNNPEYFIDKINKLPKNIKRMWLNGDWTTVTQKESKMFWGSKDLENGKLKLATKELTEPKSFASKMVKMQDEVNLHNRKKREETMKVNLEIAKICHQVNRDYCIENQLFASPKWDETSTNIQESVITGVAEVIADPKITPAESHENWLEYKASEGWKFDKVLNVEKKLHPNMVPFNKLPKVEQEKDRLFIQTVKREMKK